MHDERSEPPSPQAESMHLLSTNGWTEMADMNGTATGKDESRVEAGYTDEERNGEPSGQEATVAEDAPVANDPVVYKVYKIRWFGLMQLVLLNIIVSWDVGRTACLNSINS